MSQPTLVVMAAGIGSRYGGIKQMATLGPGGEILLDYAVYDALHAGFGEIVFIVREEILDDFRQHVEAGLARHCSVRYALQRIDAIPEGCSVPADRTKPWGTGHAVLAAADVVTGPFGVINADDFYGRESFELLCRYLGGLPADAASEGMALVGYPLEHTLTDHGHVSRGVCRLSDDGTLAEINERKRIQRFGEAVRYAVSEAEWKDVDPSTLVSMNMWGFPASFMKILDERLATFFAAHANELSTAEFLLPEVVGDMVREQKAAVRVLPTQAEWFGVTYPEDRMRVEQAIGRLTQAGVYPSPLWSG